MIVHVHTLCFPLEIDEQFPFVNSSVNNAEPAGVQQDLHGIQRWVDEGQVTFPLSGCEGGIISTRRWVTSFS